MRRWGFAFLLLLSCDESIPFSSGVREPFRVKGGQFLEGDLPAAKGGPNVTNITYTSRVVLPGEAGKRFDGRAAKPVSAVALRFLDLGTGYWVVPAGAPDGQFPMDLTWSAEMDFQADLPPGFHTIRASAVDANGVAGDPQEVSVCVASRIPDNFHACDPNTPAPNTVVSLRWDTDVDLDLVVIAPDGKRIDGKHPRYSDDIALDRDSFGGCVRDSLRQEDIVFQRAGTGNFDVYANLFDACGKQNVDFVLSVWQAQPDGSLASMVEKKGRFIAIDANGGSTSGLFLTSVSF